jgi:hypothetical protein
MTTATLTKTLGVGDILVSSWGYDQTNIDYYKIVRKSAGSVWIQKLKKQYLEQTGWAHYKVVPTDEFATETQLMKRYKAGDSVKISNYAWAYLWDGKPDTETHTC